MLDSIAVILELSVNSKFIKSIRSEIFSRANNKMESEYLEKVMDLFGVVISALQ